MKMTKWILGIKEEAGEFFAFKARSSSLCLKRRSRNELLLVPIVECEVDSVVSDIHRDEF